MSNGIRRISFSLGSIVIVIVSGIHFLSGISFPSSSFSMRVSFPFSLLPFLFPLFFSHLFSGIAKRACMCLIGLGMDPSEHLE